MIRFLSILLVCVISLSAEWYEKMTVNGYASFEYEDNLEVKNGGGYQGDPNGSFDSDLFDLVFNIRPSEKVRVAADVTWEHGPATEDGQGNVAVEYAFTEYSSSSSLKFRAGKMFTAFGIYNEIHTAKPATVNFKEPLSTNKVHYLYAYGKGMNFFTRWGSGIAVLGDLELGGIGLDYIVQVTNGQNEEGNPYDTDDNPSKAFCARVRAQASDGLQLGASFYKDTFSNYNASGDIIGEGELESAGLQAIWDINDNTRLQAEFVGGSFERSDKKVSRYGYNIMPTYNVSDSVTLYYLYEFFDQDVDEKKDMTTLHNVGFNLELDEALIIKAEIYNQSSEDKSVLTYTQFRTAFVVGF